MKNIVLIIGALVAVAIIVYLMFAKPAAAPSDVSGTPDPAATTEQSASDERDSLSGLGTFADFFGGGRSVFCTFEAAYEGGSSEGSFWYSDERMRVEATTRADGEVYTSNMINDGERTYVWGGTAAGTQAMVFDNETTETSAEDFAPYDIGQADARVSMDQQMSYDCDPWIARDTQFIPPSDIEFVDMEAMMQGLFEGELRGLPEGMDF